MANPIRYEDKNERVVITWADNAVGNEQIDERELSVSKCEPEGPCKVANGTFADQYFLNKGFSKVPLGGKGHSVFRFLKAVNQGDASELTADDLISLQNGQLLDLDKARAAFDGLLDRVARG